MRKLSRKAGLTEMKKAGKQRLFIAAGILILAVTGCGRKTQENHDMPQQAAVSEEHLEREQPIENLDSDAEHIAALYRDIYNQAAGMGTLSNKEVVRSIVERIGEHGYVVADEENQIDMAGPEQVLRFCRSVDGKQEAELTMIVVTSSGGFIKYNLHTVDGTVDVVRGYYQYVNGRLENRSTVRYPVDSWEYTKEGYLLFEGSHYSEIYYALSLSDEPEHTALRVLPLDETCRKLNRAYLLPVGYGGNNLFLVDWSEQNFEYLDFYDLFDRFYPDIYELPVPFEANDDSGVGAVYRISAEMFEHVVEVHFRIDHEELRKRTTYIPEVVSYEEKNDGTITLTVNAVYPEENTSRAFTHKTVVRPLDDGGFQYVSNQIIFPEVGFEPWWHSEVYLQAGRSKQTGSTAGNLPITEHFPQGPPYPRIEPIQDTGKVHQTACQWVFICMVWRLRAVVFNRPLLASSVIPSYSIRIVISGFLPKRRHFFQTHTPPCFL